MAIGAQIQNLNPQRRYLYVGVLFEQFWSWQFSMDRSRSVDKSAFRGIMSTIPKNTIPVHKNSSILGPEWFFWHSDTSKQHIWFINVCYSHMHSQKWSSFKDRIKKSIKKTPISSLNRRFNDQILTVLSVNLDFLKELKDFFQKKIGVYGGT